MISPQEQEFRSKLKELRDHLTKNADNVGGKFPEEARKMHYGEIEHRSIYGVASPEEAKELSEEGIEFHPLAAFAGRAELVRPHQQRDTDHHQHDTRRASRLVVGCLNTKRVTPCANRTSTSASVRTLAAVVMAKARNQNSEAKAPMNPANSEGRQARAMARETLGSRSAR